MAIYHLSVKIVKRSSGRSATAAAAYRAAEKIHDYKTDITHDYRKKRSVFGAEIIAPEGSPEWVYQREKLWNEVEKVEKRCDAQVAREIDIALPVELNREQKKELVRDFVSEQLVSEGMVADVAFHDFDSHNPHAHILLTTRPINDDGRFGFKERSWNKKDALEQLRSDWADKVNLSLEQAGYKDIKVDHRTLEEQGINRLPQIHLGPDVTKMKERGIRTSKGDEYDRISATNRRIELLEKNIDNLNSLAEIMRRQEERRQEKLKQEQLERERSTLKKEEVERFASILKQAWQCIGQPKFYETKNYYFENYEDRLKFTRKSGEVVIDLPLDGSHSPVSNIKEGDKETFEKMLEVVRIFEREEAERFASILKQTWDCLGQPNFIETNVYGFERVENQLKITRPNGELVADLSLDDSQEPVFNIEEEDKENFEGLSEIVKEVQLEKAEEEQQLKRSRGFSL